jgi:hypothetical protein
MNKLVPVEYTDEQLAAGVDQLKTVIAALGPDGASDESICGVVYDAMVHAAPQVEGVPQDIEAAAKKLAECMDYPWEYMPEQGRQAMRENAKSVLRAAAPQPVQAQEDQDHPLVIGSDSVFLAKLNCRLLKSDGTYDWPDGQLGDLLKQAKYEIDTNKAIQAGRTWQAWMDAGEQSAARVFTYRDQPGNVEAWRFGEASHNTSKKPGGDFIDTGLQLLLELQNKGYGIVAIDAALSHTNEGAQHEKGAAQ